MASVDIICYGRGKKLENQRPQSKSWFVYITSGKAFHSINVNWRAGQLYKCLGSEERPFSCQSSFLQSALASFPLLLSKSFYLSADSHYCHFCPTVSSYPHFSLHLGSSWVWRMPNLLHFSILETHNWVFMRELPLTSISSPSGGSIFRYDPGHNLVQALQ